MTIAYWITIALTLILLWLARRVRKINHSRAMWLIVLAAFCYGINITLAVVAP